jgi:hypothetical protein
LKIFGNIHESDVKHDERALWTEKHSHSDPLIKQATVNEDATELKYTWSE